MCHGVRCPPKLEVCLNSDWNQKKITIAVLNCETFVIVGYLLVVLTYKICKMGKVKQMRLKP